tara:strand:- start:154 stop:1500 length:1347 start_codon:yes stop_codon:yes gene_type:complete
MSREFQYRMLMYPNITRPNEFWKDSYVVLLPHIINTLKKINKKLHITYLLPKELDSVKGTDVEWIYYDVPSNNNRMRTNFTFDANTFHQITDFKLTPYDIVYSHLPEHTLQLSNLLFNESHSLPRFISYCHWFETTGSMSARKKMLLMNLAGVLENEVLGVNSQWLKDYVLKNASRWFKDETMEELDNIIQVHQLGVDKIDFTQKRYSGKKKILFNHRGKGYTNFQFFVKCMDELYKKRKDFEVYTTFDDTNLGGRKKWYGGLLNLPSRDEYLKWVKDNIYLQVGTFKTYSAWSISTTDTLSMGIPSVLPSGLCYSEMVGDDYPLIYKNGSMDDFLDKINSVLDNTTYRNKVVKSLEPRMKQMVWNRQIRSWMDWKDLFNPEKFEMCGVDTKGYKDTVRIIKKRKSVSQTQLIKELRWGVNFKFSRVRNRLRLNNKVRFTKEGYEWVG